MKAKKIILLSISSDIGFEVAKDLLKKKFDIVGTYNTYSNKVEALKKSGVKLFKLDVSSKSNIDQVAKKINRYIRKDWSYFISFAGQLNPINKIVNIDSDVWEKSIYINSLGQLRFLNKILKKNKKKKYFFLKVRVLMEQKIIILLTHYQKYY